MEVATDMHIAVKITSDVMPNVGTVIAHAHEREHKLANQHCAADNRCDEKNCAQHDKVPPTNAADPIQAAPSL
jgi:hypothetical protein